MEQVQNPRQNKAKVTVRPAANLGAKVLTLMSQPSFQNLLRDVVVDSAEVKRDVKFTEFRAE
jgi:hypothetical protein